MNVFAHTTVERKCAKLRDTLSIAICAALALGATQAQALVHHVANNFDTGTGSLRQAIIDANADADASNNVVFDNTVVSPITLTSGQLPISKSMTVQGPGAALLTISGNNVSRIFYVAPTAGSVSISGLKLTGGSGVNGGAVSAAANLTLQDLAIVNNAASNLGGGVFVDNYPSAVSVTLSNVTVSGNQAQQYGGGIFMDLGSSSGTATIQNSIISGNATVGSAGAGGVYVVRGAVTMSATQVVDNQSVYDGAGILAAISKLTVHDSVISGNTASGFLSKGGGILSSGALYMDRCTLDGNRAGQGGGLDLVVYGGGATITNSTISNNHATYGAGGGLVALSSTPAGSNFSVAITNSTVAGNVSGTGNGGGLYTAVGYANLGNPKGTGVLTIESSTIAGNSAQIGGGAYALNRGNAIEMHNTIVANNTAAALDPDINGSFIANYSFIRNPGVASIAGSHNNTSGADPLLGPLTVNGGPTQTMLPALGSPVIDAGNNSGAPNVDQRGLPRPVNVKADIGAVERQSPEDVVFRNGFES